MKTIIAKKDGKTGVIISEVDNRVKFQINGEEEKELALSTFKKHYRISKEEIATDKNDEIESKTPVLEEENEVVNNEPVVLDAKVDGAEGENKPADEPKADEPKAEDKKKEEKEKEDKAAVRLKNNEQKKENQAALDNLLATIQSWEGVELRQTTAYTGVRVNKKAFGDLTATSRSIEISILPIEQCEDLNLLRIKAPIGFRIKRYDNGWTLNTVILLDSKSSKEEVDFALQLIKESYRYRRDGIKIISAAKRAQMAVSADEVAEQK